MRFRRRRAPAVAAWLLMASLLVPMEAGHAQALAQGGQVAPPQDTVRQPIQRTISVNLEDTPLATALVEIARLGELRLTFSRDVLPEDHRVSLQASRISPVEALLRALDGTGLDLHIAPTGDVTIVRAAPPPGKPVKQSTITGRVADSTAGRPLAGANVAIVGTQHTTVTRDDGGFVLSGVPAGTHTLRASMIGYAPQQQEVTVAEGATVTVEFSLPPRAIQIEDLVVVGYGTQKRRDLTGSIASVQGDELRSASEPTVSAALEGKAAGLTVMSSGVPGSDATFRIRGTSTIGNSNPLVVIDGVPTMTGFNQLNPKDIESIEVLKDASATAIYGSRGANGVVIITTKSGSATGGGLEVGVYRGYQQVTQMVDMLDAAAFARLHNETMANAGRPQNPAFSDPAQLGAGTDWLGGLIDVTPIQSTSASYSGGGEVSNFYVSGNAVQQDGVIRNTGFERYTVQLNANTRAYDWLKFGNNLTLSHDVNRSGNYDIRSAMGAQPGQPVFNPDGTYSGPLGPSEWVGDIVNPIGQATLISNSTAGYNMIGSIHGDLEFSRHLSLRTNLGLQANFSNSRTWSPQYDWQPNPQEESFLREQYNRSTTWLADNTLTYSRQFGEVHDLKVMAGTSVQVNKFSFMNGSVQGFPSDRTQELANGIQPPTLTGTESKWGLLSFMGRINYSYDDKYLLTATLRRDGSSRFGAGNKWGLFPSAAVAWRVSNEKFLQGADFIDDLKLRFGYGSTGNQEIGNYAFASALQTVQYNFGGTLVSGVVPNVMPNPNVHWESVKQFNLGLDASILDNRVRLALDNLRGRFSWTTDLNFSYNQNEVVSLNDTIPLPVGSIDFNYAVGRIQAGHPINAFYGFVTNGIFQTQEEVDNYAVQVPGADPFNRTSPGDVRFVDLNNDGVINDADRTFLGDPNPDVVFGLSNSITYGNFDLRVFVQGAVGNEIFNANRIWTEGMSSARNQTTAVLDRWTGPGTSNTVPRAVFGDPNGNARASDRFIEDGSYLRVKDLTLGYSLPQGFARGLHASRARLYVAARNLWTLTGYSGFDPEVGVNGIDNNVYPVTRTFSFGIDLAF
jgi:TonB-dependent SusC/RagA subfamily outer membrane receptor